jgi:hypothetical protein
MLKLLMVMPVRSSPARTASGVVGAAPAVELVPSIQSSSTTTNSTS